MKFLAIALMLILTFQSVAFANNPVSVTVNGETVVFQGQGPEIIDGRTLVPVRGVFETLGFSVDWNDTTRTATLTGDEFVVTITIDSASFTTNGTSHTLDVPAQIIGSRTMLPIRAVLESVGFNVDWDEASRTVLISSNQQSEVALVWFVEPTIEHESIIQCGCGPSVFLNSTWEPIDPETGLLSGDIHGGHGAFNLSWVYDPASGLFGRPSYRVGHAASNVGMLPLAEFEARLRELSGSEAESMLRSSTGLLVVQRVDWSLRTLAGDGWNLSPEAFTDRSALMYNREFVTDFIFDGDSDSWMKSVNWARSTNLNTIHVSRDGLWGMVDRSGNTILPFMFEDFVRIDEDTAFARLDGRYGILDLRRTINNFQP